MTSPLTTRVTVPKGTPSSLPGQGVSRRSRPGFEIRDLEGGIVEQVEVDKTRRGPAPRGSCARLAEQARINPSVPAAKRRALILDGSRYRSRVGRLPAGRCDRQEQLVGRGGRGDQELKPHDQERGHNNRAESDSDCMRWHSARPRTDNAGTSLLYSSLHTLSMFHHTASRATPKFGSAASVDTLS